MNGTIEISGMKNAALPVLIASILAEGKCVIRNVPDVCDVAVTLEILRGIGALVNKPTSDTVEIDTTGVRGGISSYDLARKLRGSYYLLGAELGRFGRAHVAYPGGCDFGVRPIDQHVKGFEALGAKVTVEGGYIDAETESGVIANNIYFDLVTVGGTINVMLAAVRAKGLTVIENAAREPHIVDVANFLNACGAKISGAGTDTIKIRGVAHLHGCTYDIIPDMIEAGTYMIAAAAAGGRVKVNNVIPKHLESISAKLEEMGVEVIEEDDAVIVSRSTPLRRATVKTQPYPGFPTDLQPQIAALMCFAQGVSYVNENVTDNRFRYVEELRRMGAVIKVEAKQATIEGGKPLTAAAVRATDLRAGAAMVIAALAVPGVSEIDNIYCIERGYDDIVGKLSDVGAKIYKKYYPDPDQLMMAN